MVPVRNGSFRLLALTLGLAAVASAGGTSVAAGAVRGVPLGGTVTLTGRTSGYLDVRLPVAATLANGASGASISGGGRWAGFYLTDTRRNGVRLLGGRAEGSRLGPYMMPLGGVTNAASFRLPAGSYRLYLLTDGAPATVTLRLGGLSGRTSVTPSRRVPFDLYTPAAIAMSPGGGNVVVAGAAGALRGPGVAFDFLRTVNSHFQASNTEFCFYTRRPPSTPLAYAPGCPADITPVVTVVAPGVGRSEGAVYSASPDLPAGEYAQGFNFASVAVAEGFRYTAGYFPYE